jgi:hypothetical protein
MFITDDQAIALARAEIRRNAHQSDAVSKAVHDAVPGTPVMVKSLVKQPSYWLVPLLSADRVMGFVRVLGAGRVAAIGSFSHEPNLGAGAAPTITGIEASEAARQAAQLLHPEQGEVAAEPLFVHDGPPGREAWLVEVLKQGRPTRWIFVTPAFIYERPAGTLLDEGVE